MIYVPAAQILFFNILLYGLEKWYILTDGIDKNTTQQNFADTSSG